MSELHSIAALWSIVHYPSETAEWTLENKILAAKEAGFTGVVYGPRPGLREMAQKHGMRVLGYMAVSEVSQIAGAIQANREMGAHFINVHLASGSTLTPEALGLTLLLFEEARHQGVQLGIEVHRGTCTETPEKTYALADAYQNITGELLPLTWDFSHFAVVKHLAPGDYVKQLLVRPDLVQHAEQFHFRPFNGHHCQVPVTDGHGNLTPEVKEYLVFLEEVLRCWRSGKNNARRELFAIPEMGPVFGGYNLSTLPNSWDEAKVLRLEIEKIWQKLET